MGAAGNTCIKFTIVIINVLLAILGLALLGVGVWAYTDKNVRSYYDNSVFYLEINSVKFSKFFIHFDETSRYHFS